MKNIFMIQDEGTENFMSILIKIGIPENILKNEFINENQIMISEHYFKNLYDSILKEYYSYEEAINILKNNKDIEELEKLNISIFIYKILD
jgi:hypothetical protein